ncbi:MAG: putative O-methyltransferase YrrM [Flavobacteriales bacterium]|jgi:predicted O-methyltransferase YrrM
MLFQIKSYLKFLWHSKNEHAVHSPFVFTLITKCFYDKKNKPEYAILKEYKKALLENNNTIEVTDFGAGSKVFKSNKREISKIAETAGITEKRAQLLFRITSYFQPNTILEIGTSLGMATSSLALGLQKLVPKTKIVTIEGCPETSKIAQEQLKKFGLTNVECNVSEFSSYLKKVTTSTEHFSLIYFDGNHQRQATLDYFDLLLPTITNDTLWIFDDIHWSGEMEEAWETIKLHPSVTVTIDTFQWGLVFFRKEQPKEHFIIRV